MKIVKQAEGGPPNRGDPDAHGQAALMLAESLLHGLIEKRVIDLDEAMAIVATAQEIKEEKGHETGETSSTIARSIGLLDQIAVSLGADMQ